jgi:hypothetical protein
MQRKGIALIAVILLLTFVAVAISGVSSFIAQRLIAVDTQQRDMRCRYNAQAGLAYALYQYRNSGTTYASPQLVTIDSNNYAYITSAGGGGGGAAASLVIDARPVTNPPPNRELQGITISNTSTSSTITIDRMILTWTGTSRTLQRIRINGSDVWSGSISGNSADANITNFTLNPSTTYTINYIRWNSAVNGRTVTLQCVMTDGSSTTICTIFNAGSPPTSTCTTSGALTINSTGRTQGTGLYRTMQATYNTSTGNVSALTELTTAVQ